MNFIKIKIISLFFLCLVKVNSQNESFVYLDPNETVENRVNDLMSRMTLEEKGYQMNQFDGLEHMRQAEKILLKKNYFQMMLKAFTREFLVMMWLK